ncbi:hypothetical protein [Actinophytocola xinjiangensis]|uniref:hypothetical protein n=1 Tax=Actinophytocola xinjiangensis TaxID=485602 RepID=UPI0012B870BB|nr:hypothetical protein [Actinophytocola xinjiangensis]
MNISYYNPYSESEIHIVGEVVGDVFHAIELAKGLRSARGCPTVDVVVASGESLSYSTDGVRVHLGWTDVSGSSYHSVGEFSGPEGLVFDHFGSWSEVPSEWLISSGVAKVCVERFVETGSPITDNVRFILD